VTAVGSDNVGVSKIEFYVDNATSPTFLDTASPFGFSFDTKTLGNGSHTLKATAYDAAGNKTSATISITVSNASSPPDPTTPSVIMTSPANNATISGTYTLSATATDDTSITKVEFYVDGSLRSTDTSLPYSYALNTSSLSNASHAIVAKAYNPAGGVGTSATVNVTVSNGTVSYLPEDINQDGHVNLLDFSLLAGKYKQTGSNLGRVDINGDKVVDLLDFSLLAGKYER
jgi:hypothetical protein